MADFCEKSVQPIQMGQAAIPAGWSADGKSIVLASLSRRRPELLRYNIATKVSKSLAEVASYTSFVFGTVGRRCSSAR